MAKKAIAGELRTPIRIVLPGITVVNGYEKKTMKNVFAEKSYASMPSASSALLGQIAEYTGATTETAPIYTQYSLYKCVSDGGEIPVYSWRLLPPTSCKWVNAHGRDVYENQRLTLGQVATLTMRYSPKITPKCILWQGSEAGTDEVPDLNSWEVVSMDDVENRHQFLEITVKRKVVA